MNNLFEALILYGFKKYNDGSLSFTLFSGVSFQLKPVDCTWNKVGQLQAYLFSERFGKLMNYGFNTAPDILNSYEPRKLRKDVEGCLGMGMLVPENIDNKITLSSGKAIIELNEMLLMLGEIKTYTHLFDAVYRGKLSDLILMVEGFWVYLYLCKEINLSDEYILLQLDEDFMARSKRKWRPHKWPDNHLIDVFSSIYTEIIFSP